MGITDLGEHEKLTLACAYQSPSHQAGAIDQDEHIVTVSFECEAAIVEAASFRELLGIEDVEHPLVVHHLDAPAIFSRKPGEAVRPAETYADVVVAEAAAVASLEEERERPREGKVLHFHGHPSGDHVNRIALVLRALPRGSTIAVGASCAPLTGSPGASSSTAGTLAA